MEKQIVLVIFDIGGYTEFIRNNTATLTHAHDAIATLLEAITEGAEFPLILNKFEGDAVLMYADTAGNPRAAVNDVSRQVFSLFDAFRTNLATMATDRSKCPCDACQNIRNLRLKAVAHLGTAAFRKIRQFEEMAGEDVIIVHRLLKNNVSVPEYVLATERFTEHLDPAVCERSEKCSETYDHLGELALRVFPSPQAYGSPKPQNKAGGGFLRRLFGSN